MKSKIESHDNNISTPYAASLGDGSILPPMRLKTTLSRLRMLRVTTIKVKGSVVATVIENPPSSPSRRRKKTNSATRQLATIARNSALISFAASRLINFSTGIAYNTAGGDTSDTNVNTRKYDQCFGRSGQITNQRKHDKTKTYTTEPMPRCCSNPTRGLSQ